MRAKERKKQGHVPVPRHKVVKNGTDDLGDDLSGLGPTAELVQLAVDYSTEPRSQLTAAEVQAERFVAGPVLTGLCPAPPTPDPGWSRCY